MTHDLLHGDLSAAVVDNVFVLIGLPLLIAWLVVRLATREAADVRARHRNDHHRRGRMDSRPELAGVPAGPDLSREVARRLR